MSSGCSTSKPASNDAAAYREKALRELKEVLHGQNEWVKVHAAEYLLWASYPQQVKEVYLQEENQYGTQSPYRIGIWRVLAQAASSLAERDVWVKKIQDAFVDTKGKDRIHAAETLAKLKVSPILQAPEITRQALESDNKALALYTLWATAYSSAESAKGIRKQLLNGLSSGQLDVLSKRMAGYILRQLGEFTVEQWQQLAQVAVSELYHSDASIYLLSAAYVRAPANQEGSVLFGQIRTKLLEAQYSPQKGNRTELAMALAERGTSSDVPLLLSLLTTQNPLVDPTAGLPVEELRKSPDNADVRAAAAYAILKIGQREN